jgi:hypothetical protein
MRQVYVLRVIVYLNWSEGGASLRVDSVCLSLNELR